MKECPVCKESFQDELNFCDLDGSPLDGGETATVAGSSSRIWSFLGIALLLAAVGITAGAIIFFPRGPSAPLSTGKSQSGSPVASTSQSTSATQDTAQAGGSAGLDRPDTKTAASAAGSADPTKLASRKAALANADDSDSSLPNPKAIVGSDELSGTPKEPADETRPRNAKPLAIGDSGTGGRTVSADPAAADGAKPPAASAARRRPRVQSDDADSSASRKDDKKKGGFLRVFKKIFGHN